MGGRCFSHPLCLDMFLPVIPISVAMAADAEHVEERRPHPLPVMELERQTETCAHFNLLVVSQTTKKKALSLVLQSGMENINRRLPQVKNIYTGM